MHGEPTAAPPTYSLFRGARAGINWLSILSAGLVTTAIAMLGVHWALVRYRESVMSLYFWHIIPVGALGVGLVAGCGYWIAAMLLDARLSKWRVWLLVVIQMCAYFVAEYLEFQSHHYVYRDTLQPVGFWEWFHMQAMSYVFTHGDHEPTPIGGLGYAFRALEIAAFVAGVGFMAATMVNQPYCAPCGRYRKTKQLATIPAGVFVEGAGDADAESQDLERAVIDGGVSAFDALATIAEADDAETFRKQTAEFPPRIRADAVGSRLEIEINYCPGCMDARLSGRVRVKKPLTTTTEFMPERNVSVAFAEAVT